MQVSGRTGHACTRTRQACTSSDAGTQPALTLLALVRGLAHNRATSGRAACAHRPHGEPG